MTEISMWVIVELPDEALELTAHAKTALAAWEAFNQALQSVNVRKADFYIGPSRGHSKKRRVGAPQLKIAG